MIKNLINKYKEIILYGIFGVITVCINLALYKLFLVIGMHYVIASIVSYVIASLISYFFNTLLVFNSEKVEFKKELIRIAKYFMVRIWALVLDTVLLVVAIEFIKLGEFIGKIAVSVVVILVTYIFNRMILKRKDK